MGHVRMMAAVQPFLSGAISKTVNMPREATVDEVEEIYFQGWKTGPQGARDLPRQLQGGAAAVDEVQEQATAAGGRGR
jgi:ribonucleotide reductase alpha subunit